MKPDRLEAGEPKRMLIPQYSLRWLLGAITAAACLFSVVAVGVRGQAWALAVSIAFGAIALSALVYAAAFGVVWLFSVIAGDRSPTSSESPFGSPFAGTQLKAVVNANVEDRARTE